MSVRLSKKHGVNPSLLVCPLCQEEFGVALLGALKNDEEAPRHMLSTEFCVRCNELTKTHLVIARADEAMNLLGGYVAIKEEAARRVFVKLEKYTGLALATPVEFDAIALELQDMIQKD
jgi:hypothetical protein